jgi:Zn-dependent M16 (insulinase) family peptidase
LIVGWAEKDPQFDSFTFNPEYAREFVVLPSYKNLNTETFFFDGRPYDQSDSVKLELVGTLFAGEYLQKIFREKLGTQGAGTFVDPLAASLTVFSEGDPHTLRSIENFERVYQYFQDSNYR